MAVRFEIFSILGVLCWSTFSPNYSVAKSHTEALIGYFRTFDLVDGHFSGKL